MMVNALRLQGCQREASCTWRHLFFRPMRNVGEPLEADSVPENRVAASPPHLNTSP